MCVCVCVCARARAKESDEARDGETASERNKQGTHWPCDQLVWERVAGEERRERAGGRGCRNGGREHERANRERGERERREREERE